MSNLTVWKYSLPIGPRVDTAPSEIPLPFSAKVIGAAPHFDDINALEFWAELDPDATDGGVFYRSFKVLGTGDPLPDEARHRFTVRDERNSHVWHLYEIGHGRLEPEEGP
jgi:hypothetical protein